MARRTPPKTADWWTSKTRDFVLFVGGFAGVIYETVVEQVDRPALLAIFGGMMGLPVFLRRDESQAGKGKSDDTTPKKDAS